MPHREERKTSRFGSSIGASVEAQRSPSFVGPRIPLEERVKAVDPPLEEPGFFSPDPVGAGIGGLSASLASRQGRALEDVFDRITTRATRQNAVQRMFQQMSAGRDFARQATNADVTFNNVRRGLQVLQAPNPRARAEMVRALDNERRRLQQVGRRILNEVTDPDVRRGMLDQLNQQQDAVMNTSRALLGSLQRPR